MVETGRTDIAQQEFEAAFVGRPNWPAPMAGLACTLFTPPGAEAPESSPFAGTSNPRYPTKRDSYRTIVLARGAADLTGYRNAMILHILAAAYAAGEQHTMAEQTFQVVLAMAADRNLDALSSQIRRRFNPIAQLKNHTLEHGPDSHVSMTADADSER